MENVQGLLYSQIGYDLGDPMRAIVRSAAPRDLPEGAVFTVINLSTGQPACQAPLVYWGEIWHSSWWVADFSGLAEAGEYQLAVWAGEQELFRSDPFEVGFELLWKKTMRTVALDQLETRAAQARNLNGWKDCGSNWREANSHASTIIGLADLLQVGFTGLDAQDVQRLVVQMQVGCDYLLLLQRKGEALGFGSGAIVHELPDHMLVIPADVGQSVVALAKSARLLYEHAPEKSMQYLMAAEKAYRYLTEQCRPFGQAGFSASNHGAPPNYQVPNDFMTRDLLWMMWGGLELWNNGLHAYKESAVHYARRIMARQVSEAQKEGEFYGHFYTFDGSGFTEKANTHHHVGHDTGSTFPHYVAPFMEMASRWYDHPDAPRWRQTVRDFAYGYFLPACSQNPFYLLPEGYFTGQGLLTFCGPWHGINTSIAYGAALSAQFDMFFADRRFRDITVGNLQWIAGLNAGITRESLAGCLLWKEEIAPALAVPYSQIHAIGRRSVGCWSGIPGTIVNGFDTNPQFQLVVEPTVENDGPFLYTDEDWIPHAGGWISALSQHKNLKFLFP